VPASRVSFARVWLNGRDLGFYVLKEGFDKQFCDSISAIRTATCTTEVFCGKLLNRWIGSPAMRLTVCRLESGGRRHRTDPNKRLQRLDQVLDLDRFISFIAVEIMTWHWTATRSKEQLPRLP